MSRGDLIDCIRRPSKELMKEGIYCRIHTVNFTALSSIGSRRQEELVDDTVVTRGLIALEQGQCYVTWVSKIVI
jgi:hypothetical protein